MLIIESVEYALAFDASHKTTPAQKIIMKSFL